MFASGLIFGTFAIPICLTFKLGLAAMGKDVLYFRAWANEASIKSLARQERQKITVTGWETSLKAKFSNYWKSIRDHDAFVKKLKTEEQTSETSDSQPKTKSETV